ncbi:MAG: hypothetical protein AAF682_15940 [Planctomycetota bacterium]
MRSSLLLGLALLLTGCNHTTIFRADFDSDTVGGAPADMPPGEPAGDQIAISGEAANVTVVDSAPLSSIAMRIERAALALAVDCIPVGGPYVEGGFVIGFTGASQFANAAPLTVSVVDPADVPLVAFTLAGGQIEVQGAGAFPIGYAANQEHGVLLGFNLDDGTYTLTIGNGSEADSIDAAPLLPGASFAKLRFDFPAEVLEANPGVYVVDDVVISMAN